VLLYILIFGRERFGTFNLEISSKFFKNKKGEYKMKRKEFNSKVILSINDDVSDEKLDHIILETEIYLNSKINKLKIGDKDIYLRFHFTNNNV